MLQGLMKVIAAKGNQEKGKKDSRRFSEGGLTLVECLVAIAVASTTSAAIAPMMAFSVATRVQNQKTEQALQLAQGEFDKIRLVVEQGGDYGGRLSSLSLLTAPAATASVAGVAAPTAFIASTATTIAITQARKIDTDGDGDTDFAIQSFRTRGIELPSQTPGVTASTPVVFDLGVRIYDARAESNLGSLTASTTRLSFTSGEGGRGRQPLAVLYGQMAQGDREGSLCQYWQFTGSTPTNLQCN
jgi:type II secretory pathway pseudopilin PulG